MKTVLIIMVALVVLLAVAVVELADPFSTREVFSPRFQALIDKLRGAARSKTVWFNALVLAFMQQLPSLVDYAANNLPTLQPYLPASHYTTIIGAITIANVVLRFKTTHALEVK